MKSHSSLLMKSDMSPGSVINQEFATGKISTKMISKGLQSKDNRDANNLDGVQVTDESPYYYQNSMNNTSETC